MNNNIEIRYYIQEILNTDKNSFNLKKMNYIYSKKYLIKRKNNQYNSPILKSNSYQKKDKIVQKIKKNNDILIRINEEKKNENNISKLINDFKSDNNKIIVEKIKVNKKSI